MPVRGRVSGDTTHGAQGGLGSERFFLPTSKLRQTRVAFFVLIEKTKALNPGISFPGERGANGEFLTKGFCGEEAALVGFLENSEWQRTRGQGIKY